MKLLLFAFILAILLNATEGLVCRKCNDDFQYYDPDNIFGTEPCDQNSNKTTWCSDSENFCVTYKFEPQYGDSPCYKNDCDYLRLCESVGTQEVFYLKEKVTVDCCQSDLCNDQKTGELPMNVGTSMGLNKISNHICLFYVVFPVVIALLFI